MVKFLIFIMASAFSSTAWSKFSLCDIIKASGCAGVTKQLRRSSFQSAPDTSSAANLNPAAVNFDKGLGLEATFQPKNPIQLGLTSGTGKMGGALITGSRDNSFFGNRVPELDEALIERYQDEQRYKSDKISFAAAAKLFSSKSTGLDLGVILKRHPEVGTINAGVGLSGRLTIFHFGASTYKDDAYIDYDGYEDTDSHLPYTVLKGEDHYHESFRVVTYSAGVRLWNLSLDAGAINSTLKYYDDEPTRILIYSGALYFGNFLINVAQRKEESEAVVFKDPDAVQEQKNKSETYYGLQYSLGDHLILGAQYNYFLLKEYSFTATIFI